MKNKSPLVAHEQTPEAEYTIRVEKVAKLRELGIEPWPSYKQVNATSSQVISEYKEEDNSTTYAVAGRIMTMRLHGKTAFFHIQDRHGRLQVYVREDVVGEEAFKRFEQFVDNGDFVWVSGHSFKTKTGEITLKADTYELISKCLHPLPDKFHGLSDIETIYRQRYLDLITNPDSRERFRRRTMILRTLRTFLDAHDYMEVETPMLHPIPGGAAARPFITHHNALDSDFYLRIAPELYLKRLVVGGFERVYEINRNFRNEGISTRHNPEFTMLEFYTANENYVFAMDFTEEMLRTAALQACETLQLPFGEHMLNFEQPFKRITLKEAVIEFAGIQPHELSEENIDATLKAKKVSLEQKGASLGQKIYALFEQLVEHQLIQPTFVTQFPIEVSPLAKRDSHDQSVAARFELFIAGMELSNSFNELNDPFEQSERFKDQVKARQAGDSEAHYYDADFIEALEYGLPPTVGVGIGIDRLAMLLTNTTSIKDVILFPTLKKK
ncbi:MAG: lysine--tRNA ligase [Candidatus Dependentiae bacterium]|nr:lysine--tRNA ligase [Candidatus Dependentiae bacterium]